MRLFVFFLIAASAAVSVRVAAGAEHGTLETIPWRRPAAYTVPTTETPKPAVSQRPAVDRSIDVLSPGYTVLNLKSPAPAGPRLRHTPNRVQRDIRVVPASANVPTHEVAPPRRPGPTRPNLPQRQGAVIGADWQNIPPPAWDEPEPQASESWSPEGSVYMTNWQEPAGKSVPPAPKFETPPAADPPAGRRDDSAPPNRPPAATQRGNQRPAPERRSQIQTPFRRNTDSFLSRLTRMPDMFGDFNTPSVTQVSIGQAFSGDLIADIPGAGATRSFKNEHSRALPTDRVFMFYNHFHNALSVRSPFGSAEEHIDQFTFGAESTFDNGNWSVELRMPFGRDVSIDNGFANGGSNGTGNLAVTIRKLLHIDQNWVIGSGLGISTPTGDDADFNFAGRSVTVSNRAVHLVPWLAAQVASNNNWFFHAFWQIDVPTRGDSITVLNPGVSLDSGSIDHQVLMYLDFSAGYWWHRSTHPHAMGVTGVASVVELHYTTSLEDADIAQVGSFDFGNLNNQIDVVNLTLGLHVEWNQNTNFRFAAVLPMRDAQSNRFFDSEIQASLIRRY